MPAASAIHSVSLAPPHLQIADMERKITETVNTRFDEIDGRLGIVKGRLDKIEVRCAGSGCWRQACMPSVRAAVPWLCGVWWLLD